MQLSNHVNVIKANRTFYTQGDSDVIAVPAGFHCHLVGKTLVIVFQCDIDEIYFVGKLVIIIQTFSQTNGSDAI